MEPSGSTARHQPLSCERCRKQKLRCRWSSKEPGLACDRCAGAGAHCETNTARRVGRPPRHRVSQKPPRSLSVDIHQRDSRALATTSASLQPSSSSSSTQAPVALAKPDQLYRPSAALPREDEDDNGSADSHLVEGPSALNDNNAAAPRAHDDVHQFVGIFEKGESIESTLPATRAPPHAQESTSGPAEDCQLQLATLSTVLFKMPPNRNEKQTAQRGLWIMLVPQIVAHMRTLEALIIRGAGAMTEKAPKDGSGTNLHAESFSVDGPGWLLQLSCFTRVIQICRLVLASLRSSLETNKDIIREMSFEGDMMRDDEPGLKVSVLVQILSSHIDALAISLNLPEHHRVRVGQSALTHGSSTSVIDWILTGNSAERMVFGSADNMKESIISAFRAECEVLIALAS
ncbi:hypothetical protein LQW54_009355 [Pestalotiopsis sp. IQ-011]